MSRTFALAFSPSAGEAAKCLDPAQRMFAEPYIKSLGQPRGLQGHEEEEEVLQFEDEAERSSCQQHTK